MTKREVTALLAKRLVRRGYQCATAADGQQAVDAMREQPFPIVVMDVKMPNMDGIAALKVIVEQWPTAQGDPAFRPCGHAACRAGHERRRFRLPDETCRF